MRIMTFNIQHALDCKNQVINTELFGETIKKYSADICGLNEVRGEGTDPKYTDQTSAIGNYLKFNHYFGEAIKIDGTNPYGNAIVSRYPFKSAETVLIPNPDDGNYHETRCVIKTVINIDKKDICVLVCHMGLSPEEAKNAVETICSMLDNIDMPVILIGDFNLQPDSEILTPLFEKLNDTEEKFITPNYKTFASYDPKIKIDYILYRGLVCEKAQVITEIVSDHFPIIADFKIQ